MILRVTPESLERMQIPPDWGERLAVVDGQLRILGDDTGREIVYLGAAEHEILLTRDVGELLNALRCAARFPSICPTGLSHLLHDGQVPFPNTIFRDVFALAIGDRASVRCERGSLTLSFGVEFPYLAHLSREDQRPDTGRFLALLTESVARGLEGHSEAVLLMSAGKDSTPLAMALAECGRTDVRCVTYTTEGDDEHVHAREFCRRLGLSHSTVSLDRCADDATDTLTRFFTETPLPGGDLAQIAVALVLGTAVSPGSAVVEGSGNDATFGYMPYRKDRIEAALTAGRWDWVDTMRARVPPGSILNYVLRDPAEINWPGLRLRHSETRRLFDGSANTARVWRGVRREYGDLDSIDFRALLRGRHFEIGCQRQKVDLATYAFGQRAVYPYQDAPVIDYYFNLPEDERYDRRRMVNKTHLRELLRVRFDYDERAIGKRCFRFDGAAFVKRHRDLVADEIRTCGYLDRRGSDAILRAIDIVESGRDIWHHIVGLFQFAAWYNHSRYLKP